MEKKDRYAFPLTVLIALFFMWGFITVLNDILVPHLKALFSLNYAEAMLIQFCFFMAYGIMSLPSGKVVQFFGYKKALVIALFVAAIGCFIFIPAAALPSYSVFLIGLFIMATGIVLLQVTANPYVALLGKASTASSRMNLAQAFNSLGTTIAPQIGAYLILSVVSQDTAHAKAGIEELYTCIALVLILLAIGISFVKLPKILESSYEKLQVQISKMAAEEEEIHPPQDTRLKKAWLYPHLLLGSLAIFFYVGGEVSIGSFIVNFLSDPEILGITKLEAGRHVSFYWGGAMIGRFAGFLLLLKVRSRTLLTIFTLINLLLLIITMSSTGRVAGYSLLAIGLFNSIMFPTIFTLAIAGLDKFTPQGSGILCTAIVGGALIPLIQGYAADRIGIHYSFIIPFICYLYILYFAVKGSVAYCRIKKS